MTIAVLSGKGGTGKTLLSVNFAAVAGEAIYVDCDVEEPNGHLFFKPDILGEETVCAAIPLIDESRCTGCRKCVDFCRFNALAYVKGKPVLFPAVCHPCGGCTLLCPSGAIRETEKPVGVIRHGISRSVLVSTGALNTGETSGVPLIRRLRKSWQDTHALRFFDCPPGSACTVMESIQDADYCVLVAEPTIYGAHNLGMVYQLATLFYKPVGVVLNKCQGTEDPSEAFCAEHGIPIVGRIPFDARLGALSSDGKIAARESKTYRDLFRGLLDTVLKEARHETVVDPQR